MAGPVKAKLAHRDKPKASKEDARSLKRKKKQEDLKNLQAAIDSFVSKTPHPHLPTNSNSGVHV